MSKEYIWLLLIVLIVIGWDLVRRKRAASMQGESGVSPTEADLRVNEQAQADPFLDEIAEALHKALDKVKRQVADYERDLESRFANDLQLKAKLSTFARENQLDQALVCLWEEVKNYPAWSRRTDLSEWNKLGVSDLAESETGRTRAVSFSWEGERYTINHREWSGIEGETNADLSLFESEVEVFGVSSAINYTEWGRNYQCIDITAFRPEVSSFLGNLHFPLPADHWGRSRRRGLNHYQGRGAGALQPPLRCGFQARLMPVR